MLSVEWKMCMTKKYLKFVPKVQIDNKSTQIQIMAVTIKDTMLNKSHDVKWHRKAWVSENTKLNVS